MKVYGNVQHVSTRSRQLTEDLDRVEARSVAALAEQVHADGYRFVGWPTVARSWLSYRTLGGEEVELHAGHRSATVVRIRLEVIAEER